MKNNSQKTVPDKIILICTAGILIFSSEVHGRSNTITGDISLSYNFAERNYEDKDVLVTDRAGDRREYTVSPRFTWSSRGETDLFEVFYAPGLMYDDLYYTTRIDQSFILRAEKYVTRHWFVSLREFFFLGNDPVREETVAATEISALETGSMETAAENTVQAESYQPVDEQVGNREYWRNSASFLAEYRYGQNSLLGAGYTYALLRNDAGSLDGYTEYDRHDVMAHVAHRFNARWSSDVVGHYNIGLFEEPSDVSSSANGTELSNDLEQYSIAVQVDYQRSTHETVFLRNDSVYSDYESDLRMDSWAHSISMGFDYDFDKHSSLIMSGGMTFYRIEGQSWKTDYNVSARFTRQFMHASWDIYLANLYDVQSFDGRGSGLTNTWEAGAELNYQASDDLSVAISASYTDNMRLQRSYEDLLAESQAGSVITDSLEYHEKKYTAGVSLAYSFLRWYSLALGYRYSQYNNDRIDSPDYDEHRVFVQVTASKDFFRW